MRQRQVREALEFEREREQTLKEQIELVIGEAEGGRVDAAVFALMSPEDVEIVKTELNPPTFESDDGPTFFERDDVIYLDEEEEIDPQEAELLRLNQELENCRRTQRAFEAYLDALGS